MSADTSQINGEPISANEITAPAGAKHFRMRTNTAEIDSTIIHPGSVKINVKGAFIVDQEAVSPSSVSASAIGGSHDTKDIRLPNHTAVVSHIAVDVCLHPLRSGN
jgi:type II pantothenate kinase